MLELVETYAKALWGSIANVQVIVRLDNFIKQRFGSNNFNLDKSWTTLHLQYCIEQNRTAQHRASSIRWATQLLSLGGLVYLKW